MAWAVSFPHCRDPSFLSPSALAELPLAMAWCAQQWHCCPSPGDSRDPTHILTHQDMASESQPFVCVTSLHKGAKLQSTVSKTVAAKLRNTGFHHYMINKAQDYPDTTDLVPQWQKIMQLAVPQCVNHCLYWVLHWSTCCQWNSLPWQSLGSIVLLQMVIISSDLVRKWNAFSPLSWLFRQNINEIWKEFIRASGQWIHLPLSRHYKHWQKPDPSN